MTKGEGGGVSIGFFPHGINAVGERRTKLKSATEIDVHLTQKPARDAAREKVEQPRKRVRSGERSEEKAARKRFREAPKEVTVEVRCGGSLKSSRTIYRS